MKRRALACSKAFVWPQALLSDSYKICLLQNLATCESLAASMQYSIAEFLGTTPKPTQALAFGAALGERCEGHQD